MVEMAYFMLYIFYHKRKGPGPVGVGAEQWGQRELACRSVRERSCAEEQGRRIKNVVKLRRGSDCFWQLLHSGLGGSKKPCQVPIPEVPGWAESASGEGVYTTGRTEQTV